MAKAKDIITADGELYECDIDTENPLDVVVNHMVASGFSHKRIREMLHVSEAFIKKSITPHV